MLLVLLVVVVVCVTMGPIPQCPLLPILVVVVVSIPKSPSDARPVPSWIQAVDTAASNQQRRIDRTRPVFDCGNASPRSWWIGTFESFMYIYIYIPFVPGVVLYAREATSIHLYRYLQNDDDDIPRTVCLLLHFFAARKENADTPPLGRSCACWWCDIFEKYMVLTRCSDTVLIFPGYWRRRSGAGGERLPAATECAIGPSSIKSKNHIYMNHEWIYNNIKGYRYNTPSFYRTDPTFIEYDFLISVFLTIGILMDITRILQQQQLHHHHPVE